MKKSEFTIKIQNIVAFTDLKKPVQLEMILEKVKNTEWNPETFPGLIYRITDPKASALIFSQGKIVCTGTKRVEDTKIALDKIVERIRKTGTEMPDKVNMKVENMVASAKIKSILNLDKIAFDLEDSEYEPEQFPGLVYRITEPRVAFLLFTSGRIICTGAKNEEAIYDALHKLKGKLEEIGIEVIPDKP